MKQKMFGQKIQNWHRPLGPNELSTRFRRYRDQGEQREHLYFEDRDEYDTYDRYESFYWWDGADEIESSDVFRSQLIQQVLDANYPLHCLDNALPRRIACEASVDTSLIDSIPTDGIAFAQRLDEFVRRLQAYKGTDAKLVETILEAIGGKGNREILFAHSSLGAKTYLLFSPFWYRSPATWNPEAGISLESYLFARYPIPPFLTLKKEYGIAGDKWLCWLILLGQGVSLKIAADIFGWDLPNRLPALLSHVPSDLHPIEGCLHAEIQRLGGNEIDHRRIIADPSFVIDITDFAVEDDEIVFWRTTVSWLIRHRDQMSDQDCRLILSWARHIYTEAQNDHRGPFSWKGRSLRGALEQSRAYYQACEQANMYQFGHYTWLARGWGWVPSLEMKSLRGWSVLELTTIQQLFEEGQAMHHCVAGYGWRCASGISAIVSVRYQDQRRVTIEIDPKTGSMVQIHGPYNRNPHPDERNVANIWHREIILPWLTHLSNKFVS